MLAACVADPGTFDPTTTSGITSTLATSTTTTTVETTTTAATSQPFPEYELTSGDCVIGGPPEGGQPTVVIDGTLYGLDMDALSAECLVETAESTDIEWGPLGDRIRIRWEIVTDESRFSLDQAEWLEWTAPTGSRIVAVDSERVWKVDMSGQEDVDITFLEDNSELAYHPAGEHLLTIGTNSDGQYGLWLSTNQGTDPVLLAFDEGATMGDPAWTWLGEPLFVARHLNGAWHIHRVELTAEGGLAGPVIVESESSIDMLGPARHDPVMLAYRSGGTAGEWCVDGAHAMVNGVDIPEPVASLTSTPAGWLSGEQLLVVTFPDGCDAPADLWIFSAGFCPGSTYGVTPVISGITAAAAREAAPQPPPPPDFTGIIDPAPA